MQLKSVDLPAPFGPISAGDRAGLDVEVAPSTARTPPNALHDVPHLEQSPRSLEHHLLALAEDALRPRKHEADDHEPDDDQAHVGAVGAAQ